MAEDQTSTTTSDQTTDQTASQTATTTDTGAATEQSTADTSTGTTDTGGDNSTALGGETDEQAGTEAKADDKTDDKADDTATTVPETYELTAPEGFEKLDAEAVALATPVFKELGLSNEQANKLMPVAGEFAKKIIAERDQQFLGSIAEQRAAWLTEAKADPEIGGAKWDASIGEAAKALDQLGFPKGSPLRNLLNESGLGNHPEMIRAFAKVGKAIGEDSDFVRDGAGAGVAKKTDEELFDPTKKD